MKTKTLTERIKELEASDIADLVVEMFERIDKLQGYEELNAISYDANARLSKENEALLAKNKELEEELQERKAYIVANPCAQCGGRINAMKCDAWAKKAKELEAKVEIVEERLEKFIVDPYPESIFPKVSEDQIKKIHDFCQKELGFPIDRLSAAILRPCWKLISDEVSRVLK